MADPIRNDVLEAAIAADPESPDAYLVYGDWLLEHGEPLGELVSLQAARAKVPRDQSLRRRERALLTAHGAEWLGPFARDEHTWAFGFLQGLSLSDPTPARYRALLSLSAARFLRDLDIEVEPYDQQVNRTIVSAIADAGVPRTLRRLGLTTVEENPRESQLGSIDALYRHLREVRELVIRAADVDLGHIELPALQAFSLTGAIAPSVLDSIASARWPELASLSLAWTGRSFDARSTASIMGVVAPMRTPGLRHLGLVGTASGDGLLRALAQSAIVAQLTSLDLSRNRISDEGARLLLRSRDQFVHLDSIDLRENELSDDLCEELQDAYGIVVDTDGQGEAPDDDEDGERYDEIHE